MIEIDVYINKIIEISLPYLEKTFSNKKQLNEFLQAITILKENDNIQDVINTFTKIYTDFNFSQA